MNENIEIWGEELEQNNLFLNFKKIELIFILGENSTVIKNRKITDIVFTKL